MADLLESDVVLVGPGLRATPLKAAAPPRRDQTLVIYGPSKTGRAARAESIMGALDGFTAARIVVSPGRPAPR